METDTRAAEAEQTLERNRREAEALWASMSTREGRFPRSAIIRWLLRRTEQRWSAAIATTLASSIGRMIMRRFSAR
jgi:hypothetical protein